MWSSAHQGHWPPFRIAAHALRERRRCWWVKGGERETGSEGRGGEGGEREKKSRERVGRKEGEERDESQGTRREGEKREKEQEAKLEMERCGRVVVRGREGEMEERKR